MLQRARHNYGPVRERGCVPTEWLTDQPGGHSAFFGPSSFGTRFRGVVAVAERLPRFADVGRPLSDMLCINNISQSCRAHPPSSEGPAVSRVKRLLRLLLSATLTLTGAPIGPVPARDAEGGCPEAENAPCWVRCHRPGRLRGGRLGPLGGERRYPRRPPGAVRMANARKGRDSDGLEDQATGRQAREGGRLFGAYNRACGVGDGAARAFPGGGAGRRRGQPHPLPGWRGGMVRLLLATGLCQRGRGGAVHWPLPAFGSRDAAYDDRRFPLWFWHG